MVHDSARKSLGQRIVDTFIEPDSQKTAPSQQTAAPSAPPVVISNYAEFEDQFAGLLRTQPSVVAGKLHLINLSKLRDRLGERWERVKWMVQQTAEKIIERHVTPGDVYARYQDSAYYLLFPQLTLEEARLKCAIIAEEIAKQLLGQGDGLDAVEVRPVVVQVDRKHAQADSKPTETLTRLLQQAEIRLELQGKDGKDKFSAKSLSSLDYVNFVYQPMWNTSSKLVSTYLCTLTRQTPAGAVPLRDGEFRVDDADLRARVDLINLGKVVDDHRELAERGRRMILGVPVYFSTLAANESWLKYHELCRSIPPKSRQLTIFEIIEVPRGASQMHLLGVVQLLKPLVRAVIARTTLDRTDFSTFAESGLLAVGTDVNGHSGPEAQIISEIESFSESASRYGLKTYIHGLNSLSLTTAAVCAGFTYVDGDAVSSMTDAPKGVYPLETKQLYSRLRASAS